MYRRSLKRPSIFNERRVHDFQKYSWILKGTVLEKWKGSRGWNLSILGVDKDLWEFYLMFLSLEIDIKLCQIYIKIYIYKILYKNSRFKWIIFIKYTTNLKTMISQRSLRNLNLLLLLFEFNNFSFLIDIIDNIINTSVSCAHCTELPQMALSRVSFCIIWPVYCTAIGGSSSHMIRKYLFYYQLYLLKMKNY